MWNPFKKKRILSEEERFDVLCDALYRYRIAQEETEKEWRKKEEYFDKVVKEVDRRLEAREVKNV